MLAAEKAIKDLQDDAKAAAEAAEKAREDARKAKEAADLAEKSAKRWRRLTVVLGLVIGLLIVAYGVGGYIVNQTRNNTDGLRKQAISSCQIGNDRAAGTVAALDQLITVLEGPHPTAKIRGIASDLERYILQHNAPRNCEQAYKP